MLKENKEILKKVILLFLLWKLIIFSLAYIAPYVLKVFGAKFPYVYILQDSGLPYWVWSFGNFDGAHYLRIAQNGYNSEYTQVFFPVYPILIKIFSYLFFNNYLLTALIISNIAFLTGLIFLFKLIKKNYSEKIAFWSILFILFFPTSFYFGSVYTEGLFFMMIVLSFYFFDKGNVLVAALIGAFSTATRLVGLFLLISMFNFKKIKQFLPLFLIPSGLFFYMLYLYISFKNPVYFLTGQASFGQERSTSELIFLPQVFYRYLKILLTTSGFSLISAVTEFSATVFALVTIFLAFRKKIKQEWIIFSLCSVLLPTLTGTLTSMPRYIIMAFPIFIYLGMLKSTIVKSIILLFFLILLIPCVFIFTRGYWLA